MAAHKPHLLLAQQHRPRPRLLPRSREASPRLEDQRLLLVQHATYALGELAAPGLGATLAASTDCLDVAADRDKTTRASSPVMCGHNPGNVNQAVFNTGIIFLTATPATIAFCERWASTTLNLSLAVTAAGTYTLDGFRLCVSGWRAAGAAEAEAQQPPKPIACALPPARTVQVVGLE